MIGPFQIRLEDSRHRVLRLLVTNWVLGAALGALCAALFLWVDVAHLRGLIWRADRIAWEALALLFGGFAVTFGGAVCAAAVMTIPTSEHGAGGARGSTIMNPEPSDGHPTLLTRAVRSSPPR